MAWKYYYSTSSAGEHGTMYQLRNLIARSNVNADPIHKFNECEDFFKLSVTCHILVAAMEILHMEDLTDIPTIPTVGKQQDLWMQMAEKRKSIIQAICRDIVDTHVEFQFNKPPTASNDKVIEKSI